MPNIPKIKIGNVIYDIRDFDSHIAMNTSPFFGKVFKRATTYNRSFSPVDHTILTAYQSFNDLPVGPEGQQPTVKGMILDSRETIFTNATQLTLNDNVDIDYGMLIVSERDVALKIGILPISAGSWGSGNSQVIEKSVNVTKGVNLIPLTGLKVLNNTIQANTNFTCVYATGDIGNIGIALVNNAALTAYFSSGITAYASKNAGWKQIGVSPSLTKQGGIPGGDKCSLAFDGINGEITISPFDLPTSTFVYIITAFNIKNLLGHGNKILVRTKSMQSYPINTIKISRSSTAWNNAVYSFMTSALEWSRLIDLDSVPGIMNLDPCYLLIANQKEASTESVASTVKHKFDIVVLDADNRVIATDLLNLTPSDYVSKQYMEAIFPERSSDIDMIFWGDSLTAGAGGSGITYCKVCADLLGKSFLNCGVGGETENTIACRQGGNNLIIPAGPVNGTYTSDNMKDEYGKAIQPLKQGSGNGSVNPLVVNGQQCTLSYDSGSNSYTISGYSGSLLHKTPALFNGHSFYGDITVIFVGTNGLSTNTVEERISVIESMVSRINTKYVIMGLSVGDNSSDSDDAAMHKVFGNHFFPTRKMLANYGLSVQGLTPTSQDATDIANGTVPSSLRSDSVHLNANGYTALGKMLASFIVGLGYAKYAT